MPHSPAPTDSKEAQQSLYQNIAAISGDLHTHRLFDQFAEIVGPQINGFPGIYTICIEMAEALTDWELRSGAGTAVYGTLAIGWIDLVEEYVAEMLRTCIDTKTVAPADAVFARLPTLASDTAPVGPDDAIAAATDGPHDHERVSDCPLQPYSVLLLYPDYINDDGNSTFYTFTDATDPRAAVGNVRREAAAANEVSDPDDFALMAVMAGHHQLELDSRDGV